jgi:hypothetical protein
MMVYKRYLIEWMKHTNFFRFQQNSLCKLRFQMTIPLDDESALNPLHKWLDMLWRLSLYNDGLNFWKIPTYHA